MGLLPTVERAGRAALRVCGYRSVFISTRVANVHAYDARGSGDLPPIVVLHGFGSTATAFGGLLIRLRKHSRRVFAPDAPGHGFSGPATSALTPETWFEALLETIDRELDEPAVFYGNSLGGAAALRCAIARPERVRGLVIASPAGARGNPGEFEEMLATFRMRSAAEGRAFLNRLYRRPPWYAPVLAPDIVATFSRPALQELLAAASPEDLFAPEELSRLAMPILLLWGRSERIFPRTHLAYFARHLPPHTVIEEPLEFGHSPHMDDPSALTRRIVAFANDLRDDANGNGQQRAR